MPPRILIVDDSPVVRTIIKNMLGDSGYEVVGEAEGMSDAVQAYKAQRPDLVTLDFSLVKDNGLALLKALRELDGKVKVLVVSGTASGKVVKILKENGANGYLPKPFNSAELMGAIQGILKT